MILLSHDPHIAFRFAEGRIILRFHFGRRVAVFPFILSLAIVGDDGWLDLPEPIIMMGL